MVVQILLISFALILISLYFLVTRNHGYWKKKNVPHLKPTALVGNYGGYLLQKRSFGEMAQEICKKYPDEPYIGTFYGTEPALLVQDPSLIKLILAKDFYYFNSREVADHSHKEALTQNLFFTYGDRWKVLRQNLTPLFSSAKMKNMFHLITKCSHQLEDMLDIETKVSQVLEVRSLMIRYTMDCICSCAFGVNANTMQSDPSKNPFKIMGDLIFELSVVRGIVTVSKSIWPTIFYGLGLKVFPDAITKFFDDLLKGVFETRKYKPSSRQDFVDLVLSLKLNNYITGDNISNVKTGVNEKVQIPVNDELLAAQCVVFFAAGFETSAITLTLTLYELAKNKEAQERVLSEVDEYIRRSENKLNYDCIQDLPYLEACFDETLRLYPALGVLTREVREDYTLPSGLRLEKGLRIHLPVFHLHYNPDIYPDPESFKPDRFLGEAKKNIKPYTYMPFGEGQRICIGMRFAKMVLFAGMITILKKYKVELDDSTPLKVEFEPKAIVTQPAHNINLKFIPRDQWQGRVFVKDV